MKIIAEIGWNHMGDMSLAKKMILQAKASGADYAKFQTWKVDRLKPGPWDVDGRREIYEKAQLTNVDHQLLKTTCDKAGIKFLTSCFCSDDLEFVRSLSDEIKIPGTECSNVNLVSQAIEMFDTVFVSTGSSGEVEYKKWAPYGNVFLLHCVSSYPCPAENVNLPRLAHISELTSRFGYSGHYDGIWDAVAAASIGAKVIEKHFTLDKSLPGRDNKFALLPDQFMEMKKAIDEICAMNIDHGSDYLPEEQEARDVYARRWSN